MSQRYQALFNRLAEANEGAFVPFVAIGDPNREQSLAIINTLVEAGADVLVAGSFVFRSEDPSATIASLAAITS